MRIPCSALLRATLVTAACLAALGPAQAQWKWRDRNGMITASDLPPPRDVPEKDILQRPAAPARAPAPPVAAPTAAASAPAAVAAPAARTPVDKDLEAKRKATEAQQQAKQKAEEERLAQQRAENCKRARASATTLESGIRMTRVNEQGEREVLDDAARAQEMRITREAIAANCR